MTQTIIKRKFLILFLVMGLGILALVACGSNAATTTPGNTSADQQTISSELADLLRSQSGASSLQALIEGTGNSQASASTGIWVNGRGQASAEPDLAVLRLGVEALADTVAEARSDSAAQMGRVVEVLKAQAVAERDIQTTSFNINPRYTTIEVTKCLTPGGPDGPKTSSSQGTIEPSAEIEPVQQIAGEERLASPECVVERERVIVGFQVTNQLTVKVRDLDSLGGVIDEVVEAGGDLIRFEGVSFNIEDTEGLQDQARALAIEDLMKKAAQVADLAGVELGQLVFITETSGPRVTPTFNTERVAFAQSAAPTPILTGELDVVVTVQAAFDIEQPAS